MNLSNLKGSMSTANSNGSLVAADSVSDQFPVGLRVLVVDDDPTCLKILEKMLKTCLYQVTKCNRAEIALSLLRENKIGFDIVLSDVHMPDMDGFKLLEHIGLEMDLPVIMMSADDGKNVVMKGVTHGACDYLIKPVRIEALQNIWQHVVRKKKTELKETEHSGSAEDGYNQQRQNEDADYSSSATEVSWRNSRKRKDEEDEIEDKDDTSTLKKPRVVWSAELHQQFMAAVNQLGLEKAVPKKILEMMNVPGITRENVASHLQKYRLYLKRVSGGQHQGNINNPFLCPTDATFGHFAGGIDFQSLAATGHLSTQNFASLQAAQLARSSSSSSSRPALDIPMTVNDQRNLFSFANPELRYGGGHLVHGSHANMDLKQLANIHRPAQSPGNSYLMQMSQTSSVPGTGQQSSARNPVSSNAVSGGVIVRNGIREERGGYSPIAQSSLVMNLASNQRLGSLLPSSDIFRDLRQRGSGELEVQNLCMTYDPSRHSNSVQANLDVQSINQGASFGQRNGHVWSVSSHGHGSTQDLTQHTNSFPGEDIPRVKPERIPDSYGQAIIFPEQFVGDDLVNPFLQRHEGIGVVENELDFAGGYSLDNISA